MCVREILLQRIDMKRQLELSDWARKWSFVCFQGYPIFKRLTLMRLYFRLYIHLQSLYSLISKCAKLASADTRLRNISFLAGLFLKDFPLVFLLFNLNYLLQDWEIVWSCHQIFLQDGWPATHLQVLGLVGDLPGWVGQGCIREASMLKQRKNCLNWIIWWTTISCPSPLWMDSWKFPLQS